MELSFASVVVLPSARSRITRSKNKLQRDLWSIALGRARCLNTRLSPRACQTQGNRAVKRKSAIHRSHSVVQPAATEQQRSSGRLPRVARERPFVAGYCPTRLAGPDPFQAVTPPESSHSRTHFDCEHPRVLGLQTFGFDRRIPLGIAEGPVATIQPRVLFRLQY
jgi:hypothetical protein